MIIHDCLYRSAAAKCQTTLAQSDIFTILAQIHNVITENKGIVINEEDPLKNSQDAGSEQCTSDARQNDSGHGDVPENKSTKNFTPSFTAPELVEDSDLLGIAIKSEITEGDPPYFNICEGDTLIGKSDKNMFIKPDQKSSLVKKHDVSEDVVSIKHGETLDKKDNKEKKETPNQTKGKKQEKANRIWKCSECPQICSCKVNLIVHNRTHTGIKTIFSILSNRILGGGLRQGLKGFYFSISCSEFQDKHDKKTTNSKDARKECHIRLDIKNMEKFVMSCMD